MNNCWNYIFDCFIWDVPWKVEKIATNNRGYHKQCLPDVPEDLRNTTTFLRQSLANMAMTDMRGLGKNGFPDPTNPIVNTPKGPKRYEVVEFEEIVGPVFDRIIANTDLLAFTIRGKGRVLQA